MALSPSSGTILSICNAEKFNRDSDEDMIVEGLDEIIVINLDNKDNKNIFSPLDGKIIFMCMKNGLFRSFNKTRVVKHNFKTGRLYLNIEPKTELENIVVCFELDGESKERIKLFIDKEVRQVTNGEQLGKIIHGDMVYLYYNSSEYKLVEGLKIGSKLIGGITKVLQLSF